MEFKYSTTWNSNIPLHGIQVFHYMEFKLAEWIWKFHHMKFMVPFTTNLNLTMDLTDSISGFRVLFIFHSYSWIYFKIWNWNHGFIFHYSHALPLLNSWIAVWLCSDQYRFCLSQISREEWTEKQRGKSTVTSKIFKNFISKQTLCR